MSIHSKSSCEENSKPLLKALEFFAGDTAAAFFLIEHAVGDWFFPVLEYVPESLQVDCLGKLSEHYYRLPIYFPRKEPETVLIIKSTDDLVTHTKFGRLGTYLGWDSFSMRLIDLNTSGDNTSPRLLIARVSQMNDDNLNFDLPIEVFRPCFKLWEKACLNANLNAEVRIKGKLEDIIINFLKRTLSDENEHPPFVPIMDGVVQIYENDKKSICREEFIINRLTWHCTLLKKIWGEHDASTKFPNRYLLTMPEKFKNKPGWQRLSEKGVMTEKEFAQYSHGMQCYMNATTDFVRFLGTRSQNTLDWHIFARHNKLYNPELTNVSPDTVDVEEFLNDNPEPCEIVRRLAKYKPDKDDLFVTFWAVPETQRLSIPLGMLGVQPLNAKHLTGEGANGADDDTITLTSKKGFVRFSGRVPNSPDKGACEKVVLEVINAAEKVWIRSKLKPISEVLEQLEDLSDDDIIGGDGNSTKHDWCEGKGEAKEFGRVNNALTKITALEAEDVNEYLLEENGQSPKKAVIEALKCLSGVRKMLTPTALWLLALGEFRRKFPDKAPSATPNWLTDDNVNALNCFESMICPEQESEFLSLSRSAFLELCGELFLPNEKHQRNDENKQGNNGEGILEAVKLEDGVISFDVRIKFDGLVNGLNERITPQESESPVVQSRGTSSALLKVQRLFGHSSKCRDGVVMKPGPLTVERAKASNGVDVTRFTFKCVEP